MQFGPDGHLYVVGRFNHRVARYDGQKGALLGPFVTNNLSQPFGLRFAPDGDLLVASGNQNRLHRFNGQTGAFVTTLSSAGGLHLPIGLIYGADGSLLVASYGNHRVAKFDATTGSYLGDLVLANSGGLTGPNFMLLRTTPALAVHRDETNVVVRWPYGELAWQLEATTRLSEANWSMVTNVPVTVDRSNEVRVPMETEQFFRLAR
jgi:WD40 repeat protein